MGFYDRRTGDTILAYEEEENIAEEIAERETWLKSHGMAPYTLPEDRHIEEGNYGNNGYNIVTKANVDTDPDSCEKVPGALSVGFERHLDYLKDQCLNSLNWNGAQNQILHAMRNHSINKVVVLGLGSVYRYCSSFIFWQYEIAFVLSIHHLAKEQAKRNNLPPPDLIFQDPRFCPADIRLLTDLGGHVVEHPTAFLQIDPHTFAFAKSPPHEVTFNWLLQTSPAVCVSMDLNESTEAALNLQTRYGDFKNVDLSAIATDFMKSRKAVDLHDVLLPLYPDMPERGDDNFVEFMSVFWVEEEEDVMLEAKKVGNLRKSAKKWLESL